MKNQIDLGTYKHYKGGIYEVVAIAKHSETLEDMVIYKSKTDGGFWARPAYMWNETVILNNTETPRFKKI